MKSPMLVSCLPRVFNRSIVNQDLRLSEENYHALPKLLRMSRLYLGLDAAYNYKRGMQNRKQIAIFSVDPKDVAQPTTT